MFNSVKDDRVAIRIVGKFFLSFFLLFSDKLII